MTIVLSIFAVILVGSVIVSAIFYSRQQALAKRDAQVKKHKQKADELHSLISTLQKIDPNYELLVLLQSQALASLELAYGLNSQDQTLASQLATQRALDRQFRQGSRDGQLVAAFDDESSLSAVYFHLLQIGKILDMMAVNGRLSRAKCDELANYLKALRLNLEVNSHIRQAEKHGQKKDFVMYQTHLKHALQALKKTSFDLPDKNQRIKQISEWIQAAKTHHKMHFDPAPESQSAPEDTTDKPPSAEPDSSS